MSYNYVRDIIPIIKNAGDLVHRKFMQTRSVRVKSKANYVTDLDVLVETNVVASIRALGINDDIVSEEGTAFSDATTCWILDPIDGTTNLIHGYPSITISLAHKIAGEIVFGTVYCPLTQEIFYAEKGKGAYLMNNGDITQLSVSGRDTLQGSLVGFGYPYDRTKIDYLFSILKPLIMECDDLKRKGPASLDICYVASGRLDAYIELDLECWDYSAGELILTEAGGFIRDFNGEHPVGKSNIVASNGKLQDKLLKVISNR